ncbi:hypothetical protein CL654_01875 [bacterium]|nr:hypothetical protein [bacterium]
MKFPILSSLGVKVLYLKNRLKKSSKKTIENIAKAEKTSIDDDAVSLIAFLGDGSFRDTQGYLEQVLSLTKNKSITRDEVESLTGAPSHKLVIDYIESILDKEVERGIEALKKANNKNTDMKLFARLIMNYMRNAMLVSFSSSIKEGLEEELGDDQAKEIEALGSHPHAKELPRMLRRLIEAYEEIKYAHISSLPLELALVDVIGQDK